MVGYDDEDIFVYVGRPGVWPPEARDVVGPDLPPALRADPQDKRKQPFWCTLRFPR